MLNDQKPTADFKEMSINHLKVTAATSMKASPQLQYMIITKLYYTVISNVWSQAKDKTELQIKLKDK